MEVALWNLHHGSYLVELTPWKLLRRAYTMHVTFGNLHHRGYLVELTPWKFPHGTYTKEGT